MARLKDEYGFLGFRNELVGESKLFVWGFNCLFNDSGLTSILCIAGSEKQISIFVCQSTISVSHLNQLDYI